MAYHKTLERQLSRFLPKEISAEAIAPLLKVISNYYDSQESDKKLSDHAFFVSEKEYQDVLQNLKEQDEIKRQSVEKLRAVLQLLDQRLGLNKGFEYDLISVVNDIEEQVGLSRKLKSELKAAKEAAENLAKAKGNFLSVMSHEIRTPLNAIVGNIHLLDQEPHLPDQESLIHSLKISSHTLLSLINDILDFSKIDEGKIIIVEKDFALCKLMSNLQEAHHRLAQENHNVLELSFDPEIPSLACGDEVRLNQIMNNLTGNALKFTDHGKVTLSAKLLRSDDHTLLVRLSVSDTGIGIPLNKQEQIFEWFTQANSDIDRKFGGSGLGLTIVKKLVHLLGSEVRLESEPGAGSLFYFDLPLKRSSEKNNPTVNSRPIADLGGIHILLVEDTEMNVKMAERMLERWNATVDVAVNGKEAVEKSKLNRYDVILMDIQMPVMDGLTASKAIRTFDPTIPIIALSAYTDVGNDIKEAGMSDSIAKPFNPQEFLKMLIRWTKN